MNQLGKKYFNTQNKWTDLNRDEVPSMKRHLRRRIVEKLTPLYSWRDEHSIERFNREDKSSGKNEYTH